MTFGKTKAEMQVDLEFHRAAKSSLQEAYLALTSGGVQSYTIGSRSLTRLDMEKIRTEIAAHEKSIAELSAALSGKRRVRAVGIIPRDT